MSAKHTPTPRLNFIKAKTLIHVDIESGTPEAPIVTQLGSLTKDKLNLVEFIVRAVNSYDALLEAAKDLLDYFPERHPMRNKYKDLIAQAEKGAL